ncbi:MAG: hypothetical protein JXR48_06335 [Candidatus Delongbacteria bacterium]|nr:hypothetical protein [Candidatus Delongbacteria bacterium]
MTEDEGFVINIRNSGNRYYLKILLKDSGFKEFVVYGLKSGKKSFYPILTPIHLINFQIEKDKILDAILLNEYVDLKKELKKIDLIMKSYTLLDKLPFIESYNSTCFFHLLRKFENFISKNRLIHNTKIYYSLFLRYLVYCLGIDISINDLISSYGSIFSKFDSAKPKLVEKFCNLYNSKIDDLADYIDNPEVDYDYLINLLKNHIFVHLNIKI